MFRLLICFIILNSLLSCDNCADIACTSPPKELNFQLINKATESDLFLDSLYSPEKIKIINTSTNKEQLITVTNDSENYTFICSEIGWELGEENKSYILTISNEKTYTFIYHTEEKTVECCNLLGNLIEFSSADFDIENTPTINKIILNL